MATAEEARARRIKAIIARARIRKWEYRQRHHAHGAWMRFRIALAHAEEAFEIDEETHATLVSDGFRADDAGAGLSPARTLVWISATRASTLERARPLALRLDAALLGARHLALVPLKKR